MGSQTSQAPGVSKVQTTTSGDVALKKGRVSVEIRGQRLSIRSDKDPAFVQNLANYVDEKVAALQSAAPSAPFDKLLMLASMTVAEELFETKQQLNTIQNKTKDHTTTLFELLDELETA